MKTRILLLLTALVVIQSYGQEKIKQFGLKVADNAGSSFYFSDLEYPADGTLSVYGRLWRFGTLSAMQNGKKTDHGSGNTLIPSVAAFTIVDNKVSVSQDYINLQSFPKSDMKGYEYKVIDPSSKEQFASSADKSAEELKLKYPKSFPAAKEETQNFYNYQLQVSLFKTTVLEVETKYVIDAVRNKLIAETPKRTVIDPKLPEADGKYLFEGPYFKDNKRKMIACVAGVAKKGESKFYSMQNRKVLTFGGNGDLITSFDVQFTYPRSLLFAAPLGISATDTVSTFEDGGIFIFGKVFGAGKNNDPDPTNYDYVIVDAQGKLQSKGTFKFGADKRDLSPLYAYKKDNKIIVFAKGVGKDLPGYALLSFDDSGFLQAKEYPAVQLKAITFGPYDKGITTNYGRLFLPTNHINLQNGGILLGGEAYEDETPVGASFSDPKVRSYSSQVFLYIDKEGNLVKNMVVEKTEADSKKIFTRQLLLEEKNSKLAFVSEEKIGKNNFPILTVVDPLNGTARKVSLKQDNIYNIDGDIIFRFFPERSEVLFLGRNSDNDSYTINAAAYKLY